MYVRFPASSGWMTLPEFRPWVVPNSSPPKRRAPSSVPNAVFRPRRATAMPRKPTLLNGTSRLTVVVEVAEHVHRSGQSCEGAGDRHRANEVLLHADAAIRGGFRVEADCLHLVAEGRAVEEDPEDDERSEGDEDPDVETLEALGAPEDGQLCALRDGVGHRGGTDRSSSAADRRRRTARTPDRWRSS